MPQRDDLKVVAHLADGSLVKGILRDTESFDPLSAGLIGQTLPSTVAVELPEGGSRTVDLKNAKALSEAGKFLETNRFGLAVVAGHTDMKGDTEKNRVLTEARAMVVRDYLVQNFKLDDTRIKTIGQGEGADGNTPAGVEILVYPIGTSPPNPQRAPSAKR